MGSDHKMPIFKSGKEIREAKLKKAFALEILKDVPEQEIPHTYTRACFHNQKGICYFVSNDPDPCHGICPNWKTYSKSFIRSLGKSREYMDWYMLVKPALVRNESRAIVQTMFMGTEEKRSDKGG